MRLEATAILRGFDDILLFPGPCNYQKKPKKHLETTLQETNISPPEALLKMIFLLPRWDMLISWRVRLFKFEPSVVSSWFPPNLPSWFLDVSHLSISNYFEPV